MNILMKSVFVLAGLISSTAHAESLVCGLSNVNRLPEAHVRLFHHLEDRNGPSPLRFLVAVTRVFRDGQMVSEVTDHPLRIEGVGAEREGSRSWTLERQGSLIFQSEFVKLHRYHGTVFYVAPGGPELPEMIPDCFLDPTEVGITVKN